MPCYFIVDFLTQFFKNFNALLFYTFTFGVLFHKLSLTSLYLIKATGFKMDNCDSA